MNNINLGALSQLWNQLQQTTLLLVPFIKAFVALFISLIRFVADIISIIASKF